MKKQIALYAAVFVCVCAVALYFRTIQTDILPEAIASGEAVLDFSPGTAVAGSEYDAVIKQGLSDADVIVQARFTGERRVMDRNMLGNVAVTKVWKGDEALLDREIGVFERNYFYVENGKAYYHVDVVENLMREGEEYILFLKEVDYPRVGKDGLKEYTMDWLFAEVGVNLPCLIPVKDEPTVAIVTDEQIADGSVRYCDVKEADFVCSDRSVAEAVKARNQNIREWFELY